MTMLSVNINKAATLRNARGGNNPDLINFAIDCQKFGADGITIHPRPDERHIKKSDVFELKKVIKKEFNIEGYPSKDFIELVLKVHPHQVTLVPDPPHILTSNKGWDICNYKSFLKNIINEFKLAGIRTSIFVDPDLEMVKAAKEINTDRVELYTEFYANQFLINKKMAISKYLEAATLASEIDLELNAGHDLDLKNLSFFSRNIPALKEVSIGHALICDALYLGLEKTIKMYKDKLQ